MSTMDTFTVSELLSPSLWIMFNCRAERGKKWSDREKEGVKTHGLAHPAAKLMRPGLGNVAIADTMVPGFTRDEAGYHPNSSLKPSHLGKLAIFGW